MFNPAAARTIYDKNDTYIASKFIDVIKVRPTSYTYTNLPTNSRILPLQVLTFLSHSTHPVQVLYLEKGWEPIHKAEKRLTLGISLFGW